MVNLDPEKWENESYTTATDERHSSKDEIIIMPSMDEMMAEVEKGVSLDVPVPRKNTKLIDEKLQLPHSTHSFLFTEPVTSLPFVFGVGIAVISYACLSLALCNNLSSGKVPANVDISVRIAQYLSIFIALLMEEEIPTGLYLLRRFSKPHLKREFPTGK